ELLALCFAPPIRLLCSSQVPSHGLGERITVHPYPTARAVRRSEPGQQTPPSAATVAAGTAYGQSVLRPAFTPAEGWVFIQVLNCRLVRSRVAGELLATVDAARVSCPESPLNIRGNSPFIGHGPTYGVAAR